MKRMIEVPRNILARFLGRIHKDQRGITGLETAIVLIAFVVVAAVFAFAVITTGLFSSEKAAETASAGLGEASTTLLPKGAVIGQSNSGSDAVATVKYKLTNSGADAVALGATSTLLTYTDQNNLTTLIRAADIIGTGATSPWWWSDWKLGSGDSLDSGEVVEITVGLFTSVATGIITEGAVYAAGDAALTLGVGEGALFAIGDTIYIEQEQISVTGIAGDVLTVTRGFNGTTDVNHADSLSVAIVGSQLTTNLGVNMPFKIEMIPSEHRQHPCRHANGPAKVPDHRRGRFVDRRIQDSRDLFWHSAGAAESVCSRR